MNISGPAAVAKPEMLFYAPGDLTVTVELWYLLHFMYMDTDIDRSRYWPKLSDWMKNIGAGGYEKNRPDMYEVLRPYMDIAIANAKRLDKQNEGRKPSESAPGTKVYELVEMLKPYLSNTQ